MAVRYHPRMIPNRAGLVLATLALAGAAGCSQSDRAVTAAPRLVELHLDGDNASAPNLPPATWEAAARFAAALTAPLAGGELVEIDVFVETIPADARLKVYGAGTASAPGPLVYSADVLDALVPSSWITHVLPAPVAVTGGDLWIALEFTHAAPQRVIGCDPGPAVTDGDWLYASTDGTWIPFHQRFASSVNWNVRGTVRIAD